MWFQLCLQRKVRAFLTSALFQVSLQFSVSFFVFLLILEEEKTDTTEATASPSAPKDLLSKNDKKKSQMEKRDASKPKTKPNGTTVKPTEENRSKSSPKKAKIAKMDGEGVKAAGVKKPTVKADVKNEAPKSDKNEGSRFEKKQAKKRKKPTILKKRLGKNKFQKLKTMLKKHERE